jgi:hypothetical protein
VTHGQTAGALARRKQAEGQTDLLDIPALSLLTLVLLAPCLGLNLAVGDARLPVDAVADGVRPASLGPEILDLLALLDYPVVPLEPICPSRWPTSAPSSLCTLTCSRLGGMRADGVRPCSP